MMSYKKNIVHVLIIAVFITLLTTMTVFAAQIVSVSSTGTQGNGSSFVPAISADGRYVAYSSSASNLVAGDTNGQADIFVYDRTTGTTTRASVATGGAQATGGFSSSPGISANGRYVAFESFADNLVAGDTNGTADVFVRDLIAGTTIRVSVDSAGTQSNDISSGASISADGRYVVFSSRASNLVAGDTNGAFDVFVRDLVANTTTRVSVATGGTEATGGSVNPSISADGRYVAFESSAANLVAGDTNGVGDVFLHDLTTNTTIRVSVDSLGVQATNFSLAGKVSANGGFVIFSSAAANLVSGDTNGVQDTFMHNIATGVTTRISVDSSGAQANGYSDVDFGASNVISGDGRYVVFFSVASNLVTGDTNGVGDAFLRDLTTGTTTRVSVDSNGVQGNGESYGPTISNNGIIAFESDASNLIASDTNGRRDIFIYDPIVTTTVADPSSDDSASSLPKTGFAPNKVTNLSAQPATLEYAKLGDLVLEIPSLNVKSTIVGVPQNKDKTWDVTWLGNDTGWLNGTAFPTWNGNSVLTAHVVNASGLDGPFAALKSLKYGDQVIVHLGGVKYVYEVRETKLSRPYATNYTFESKSDASYLTLVTCSGYSPLNESYLFRRVVRAVLVSTISE